MGEVAQLAVRRLLLLPSAALPQAQLSDRAGLPVVEVDVSADVEVEEVAAPHEPALHEELFVGGGALGGLHAALSVVRLGQVPDEVVVGHGFGGGLIQLRLVLLLC